MKDYGEITLVSQGKSHHNIPTIEQVGCLNAYPNSEKKLDTIYCVRILSHQNWDLLRIQQ